MKWRKIIKGMNMNEIIKLIDKNNKEIKELRCSNSEYSNISCARAIEILSEQGKLVK